MKILFLFLFTIVNLTYNSQIRQSLSQYMLHQQTYNPGFADPETKFSINGLYKRQWVTQTNFPEAAILYGHYNLDQSHSVGAMISNDLMNNVNQFEASINYVYNIPFSYEANLGLGLKVGMVEQNLINKNLIYFDPIEPVLDGQNITNTHMNAGFGISITSPQFNMHLSAPYLFGNTYLNSNEVYNIKYNHLYLNLGYKYRSSDWFIVYPTIFVNALEGAPLHGKFNLSFLTSQLIWTGLGVSTDMTINCTLGIFTMGGLRLLYSFDVTALSKHYNTGITHEASLSYAKTIDDSPFRKKKSRYRTPRGYRR